MWEQDGEEWQAGNALRLDSDGPAIFVELKDKRCKFTGVWLDPVDVWWKGKDTRRGQSVDELARSKRQMGDVSVITPSSAT